VYLIKFNEFEHGAVVPKLKGGVKELLKGKSNEEFAGTLKPFDSLIANNSYLVLAVNRYK
jgi:hypothetical protein